MPWARSLRSLSTNVVDGIFHASFNEDRTKLGHYPMKDGKVDPERNMLTQSYVLYKRKDSTLSWDGKKFKNLKGKIGVILNYAIVKDLKKMKVELDEVRSQLVNLNKLVKGRVAGVVGIENMNDTPIKENPELFKDIVKVEPAVKRKKYYLMLSKDYVKRNPKTSEKIWDTIREIRESEEYQKIVEKY
jgi:polar amino acid transport system substrate-binding protein